MIALADIERDAVIVACAISAGIHAALTPDHVAEGTGAGLGFLGAAVSLGALIAVLTRRPSAVALLATVAVLSGLLGSYVLAITSGLPLLHPEPEPVTGLALFTKAIEICGLLAASHLLWRGRPTVAVTHLRPKGTVT
jgi:CHASE2 domain-containing sensor protein